MGKCRVFFSQPVRSLGPSHSRVTILLKLIWNQLSSLFYLFRYVSIDSHCSSDCSAVSNINLNVECSRRLRVRLYRIQSDIRRKRWLRSSWEQLFYWIVHIEKPGWKSNFGPRKHQFGWWVEFQSIGADQNIHPWMEIEWRIERRIAPRWATLYILNSFYKFPLILEIVGVSSTLFVTKKITFFSESYNHSILSWRQTRHQSDRH